ncbi:MAG: NAD+ synthase [Candidatus Eisenbacteria bacterium]|nr:NAD+ synthase [Candidatus Eisenbacteria bacterium]
MRRLRLALAQINVTVGDLAGNSEKIVEWTQMARKAGADVVAFPELVITGYPPEDLLLKPAFVKENLKYLDVVASKTKGIVSIVGFVDKQVGIHNALAVIHDGDVKAIYRKMYLPNYGVFDEKRYFEPGTECLVFSIDGINVGVNICEDIWHPDGPAKTEVVSGGAEIVINISSSPYHAGKGEMRERMLVTRAMDNAACVGYVNLVGGQDELLFDGRSLIIDQKGNIKARALTFEEELLISDIDVDDIFRARLHDPRVREKKPGVSSGEEKLAFVKLDQEIQFPKPATPPQIHESLPLVEEIYKGLVLGTRDYVRKNGFRKVVLGLSGGIDSSLTAVISVDALGKANVLGVFLPSQFTSSESAEDTHELCSRLGIELITIPITDILEKCKQSLDPVFRGHEENITEENLQARIRGTLLMAISNKFGHLVFSTGNKSELSTGYCTLYGDMVGGFAVIKDVPKELVYSLAGMRNKNGSPIPERVLTKVPSAELKPNQKDEDTLPPYPVLDPILEFYIEKDMSLAEITSMGYDEATVKAVIDMVDRSEYKRRQGPLGIKISPRAFGKDRRLPITNRFRERIQSE